MNIKFSKNQTIRQRLRTKHSFKRILISFILAAGAFQVAILNHYLASGILADVSDTPSDTSIPNHSYESDVKVSKKKNNTTAISLASNKDKKKTDVIVYLAQFGNHSSYGAQLDANRQAITGLSKLNKSLELLYTNYAYDFPTDVIIFYDSMNLPDADTMTALQRNRPYLQFRPLDEKKWWSLPHGLQTWQHYFWKRPAFSIGYRLMMRWYAVLIWFYLYGEGYTHCMRLDDDSYILSKIKYNLFDYMRDNKKKYAFVQPVYEPGGDEFDGLVNKYLKEYPTSVSQESVDLYNQDRGVGFYNNFFMADVTFFMTPPASSFLDIVDASKLIFTHRLGDLVIQSAVARLFLSPKEVHWFRDFTYEHMTLCRKEKCGPMIPQGCPQNGGVSRGIGQYTEVEWRRFATEDVRNRFKNNPKRCSVPINQFFVGADDVRDCSRLRSRCGFYLKLISGANDTAEDAAWLQSAFEDETLRNKTLCQIGGDCNIS